MMGECCADSMRRAGEQEVQSQGRQDIRTRWHLQGRGSRNGSRIHEKGKRGEWNMAIQEAAIRSLADDEICLEFFREFHRHQVVGDCWRRVDGVWVIRPDPFIDDWSEEDYRYLVRCLKNTVSTGGVVYGALIEGVLKGFASVEAEHFGSVGQYLDLTSIHVSEELRGSGIGKRLFLMAADWAREHGAGKLYISAHSAVESQAFYRALGCVEAEEYKKEHVEAEPYDCQLEYVL